MVANETVNATFTNHRIITMDGCKNEQLLLPMNHDLRTKNDTFFYQKIYQLSQDEIPGNNFIFRIYVETDRTHVRANEVIGFTSMS